MADWSDYETVRDLAADLEKRVTALTDEIKALPPYGRQTSEQQQEAFDLRRHRTLLYERMSVLSAVRNYLYARYEERAQREETPIRDLDLEAEDIERLGLLGELTQNNEPLVSSDDHATPELTFLASVLGPQTDVEAMLDRLDAEASIRRGGRSASGG